MLERGKVEDIRLFWGAGADTRTVKFGHSEFGDVRVTPLELAELVGTREEMMKALGENEAINKKEALEEDREAIEEDKALAQRGRGS